MIGAGIVEKDFCVRPQESMWKKGNHLTKEAVTNIDPDKNTLTTDSGAKWTYD